MPQLSALLRQFKQFTNDTADRALRRPPVFYSRYRALLADQENWDEARRQRWMVDRITRTLTRAARLPGYSGWAGPALSDWPLLEKREVAGHEARFTNPKVLPWHAASTGGTTGRPLALRRSLAAIAFEQAAIDHMCAGVGLDMEKARVAVLRADHVKPLKDRTPPFWRQANPQKLLLSSFHLTPDSIKAYAGALRAFQPDLLMCYPSALGHFIELLKASGENVHIPFVLASSETLPASVVRDARQVLATTVIDYYGQAERVAASCGINGAPHQLLPLYGLVELSEELGEGREIIGTSLWNDAQILVRYRTGDVLRIAADNNKTPSSGPLPPDAGFYIEGRGTERIDLKDGRVIVGLNHLPRGVPGIVSLQVRHSAPREVELLVVPANGYGPASDDAIRANCALKFPDDVTLRIVTIEAPVRLASGKAPLLLRD